MVDKLPALEGTTISARVGEHISALHASRKAFTEAECSERIRRALRKQLRPTDDKYETGEKVYYKRADCTEWKGPGVVIGQDGVVVFVKHGGILVRVHQSRLCKVNRQNEDKQIVKDDLCRKAENEKTISNNAADSSDSEHNTGTDNTSDREVLHSSMTQANVT